MVVSFFFPIFVPDKGKPVFNPSLFLPYIPSHSSLNPLIINRLHQPVGTISFVPPITKHMMCTVNIQEMHQKSVHNMSALDRDMTPEELYHVIEQDIDYIYENN